MRDERISLAHGGGGRLMAELLAEYVLPPLGVGEAGEDAAVVEDGLVMTTDTFVVKPLVFPGGDIGKLAVCGTVNDLAMRGARPVAMTVGLVLEEGFEVAVLDQVMRSLGATAQECGVRLVGGDTKVVEAGRGDGLYVNTAGVGRAVMAEGEMPSLRRVQPGDQVLLNGPPGMHGVAVLAAREQLGFASEVVSDCAPLHELAGALVEELGPQVHCLHDPTRGGVAAALKEIAEASGVTVRVEEEAIPRDESVEAACELLGFDSLQVANEGKMVVVVSPEVADAALEIMRADKYGEGSSIIGEVTQAGEGRVELRTQLGTIRNLEMPSGEILPRIC